MSSPFATDLQVFNYLDKYSRYDYDLGRREFWPETVQRTVEHLKWVVSANSNRQFSDGFWDTIYHSIHNLDVMPSMRNLAMAGKAAKRQGLSSYNCAAVVIDDFGRFKEAVTILIAGTGLGYSVESRYVNKFPSVKHQTGDNVTFVIPDTSEGWANAIYTGIVKWWNGEDVYFDYSLIRPAGTPLKTKGGRAAGGDGLRESLNKIRAIILNRQGRKVTTLDIHDIMCHIARCVVSGGVRRSAMLCLFDYDDNLMRTCKSPENITGNEQRWLCNNSVVIEEKLSRNESDNLVESMIATNMGEPGFFMRYALSNTKPKRRKDADWITNACQPGFATLKTKQGIVTFDDVNIGDEIWSSEGWTKVINKWSTGIKEVFAYGFYGATFIGTEDHKVVTRDGKIEIDKCYGELHVSLEDDNWEIPNLRIYLGQYEVFDITVDNDSHTYWTGGVNVSNCSEIVKRPTGSLCNLTSIVARPEDGYKKLLEKCYIATVIGTIQSMELNLVGLRDEWVENAKEERLLGVDINNFMSCATVRDPVVLHNLKRYAVDINKQLSDYLGIEQSKAVTCVKPSGNSGVMLNASPGIHTHWNDYYIRRAQVQRQSPIARLFLDHAPEYIEPMIGNEDKTYVLSFPTKAPDGAITRDELSCIDQCNYWLMAKENYTEHNPSVTISYRDEEIGDMKNWIYEHQDVMGGMAFLPRFDAHYQQMPYESISKERYEDLHEKFPPIPWHLLPDYEQGDYTNASMTVACDSEKCELVYN